MKKTLALLLVLVMAMTAAAGCGSAGSASSSGSAAEENAQGAALDSIKTFGDIIDLESEDCHMSCGKDSIVYAFMLDDKYYRASSALDAETVEAVWNLDVTADDYDQKYKELVGDIAIEEIKDITDQKLSQDELDALVGKTGQELVDDGWYSAGYDLENMQFWMNYGPFVYNMVFEGEVADADSDTFDENEAIKPLTVKSAEFMMLGSAATD